MDLVLKMSKGSHPKKKALFSSTLANEACSAAHTDTGGEKVPRACIHPSAEFSPLQKSQIIQLQIMFYTHCRIQLYAFANLTFRLVGKYFVFNG